MYADTEILFPYFQNFSQEAQQLEEYCKTHKSCASMGHLAQASILEYDLGGEGDLFKAPEPIIEEQFVSLDPMTAAISMISCGQDVISTQGLKVADIESLQNEQLLSEVFYECRKDLLEKAAIEAPPFEVLDIKIPLSSIDENKIQENRQLPAVPFQKSVSSECLSSMEWMHGAAVKPSFLDFPGMDLGTVYGMRRAFSDGDIKTLGNGMSLIHSPLERPLIVSNCTTEERREKLSRYRNKKTKRNFGRKIKYACRKALADSQPRVRGRFAKTDESDAKRQELLTNSV
ncbi:putative zinc finger protein CONSTANS-LIKE 11 [Juglans microcarpa x Juglans regia]|uniref:putative zinc finger protein CONSTANS-LIKE 11 n=1 Tax=Juglans microcarpa x Juglans regia TaxID=2249226 RepID=UPI001B7E8947|nr:putative zinc finger protein CONSTANS-LIKE 11 [Juglans microcarpa x Juglans regia]